MHHVVLCVSVVLQCALCECGADMSDDARPTSADSAAGRASNSTTARAAMSSLLITDDVASSSDDQPTRVDQRSSKHAHHTVHIRDPPVSDTCQPTTSGGGGGGQTAVWSEQKHGPLHRAIPSMPLPLAVIACILNIILPGTGQRTALTCRRHSADSRRRSLYALG